MILPVISDIHSNLDALEKVVEKIDYGRILCCGDIVGYYTQPNECIEIIRKLKTISVTGNHDLACVTGDTSGFNPYAEQAMDWTRKFINHRNIEFLRNLKRKVMLKIDDVNIMVVHGSPRDPISEYIFPSTPDSTLKSFLESENVDILIMGHTHVPFIKKYGDKLVFNPGSVGQPRDGNNRASFAFLDVSNMEVVIHRVKYNVDKVVTSLEDEKLPSFLGERLYKGI
ncbi:metallophosphoesterase family protein [Methanobacterium sp.]|uniref:metallophosphoesterase family protein n=1 Tax=Methanobacterium sp. TaxID=2164 RepID=UPI003C746434